MDWTMTRIPMEELAMNMMTCEQGMGQRGGAFTTRGGAFDTIV